MAAELEKLIEDFRIKGHNRAANFLVHVEEAMYEADLLPPSLGVRQREIAIHHGRVFVENRTYLLGNMYDIDALALPRSVRNSLVSSGIATFEDVEWANNRKLLHLIGGVSMRSARLIAAQMEFPYPYLVGRRKASMPG